MKAALYLRVSTDVQDYERQKSDLTALINRNGDTIVYTFSDKVSGLKDETKREGLAELLKLTKEDVDVIYCSELSRLSRNPIHLRRLVDEFTEKGINIYFHAHNLTTLKDGRRDAMTNVIITILAEFAGEEIEEKNRRSKSGKKQAIQVKGNSYSYKPSYGYMNVDKKLVINEEEAEVVREIFKRYADGSSMKEILNYLNLNGIPTRNSNFIKKESFKVNGKSALNKAELKWSRSTVSKLLKNTVYTGTKTTYSDVKTSKKSYEVKTPQIISPELFQKCQEAATEKIFKTDKTRKNEFMLRGILKCGECGNYFVGNQSHGVLHYECSDKTHTRGNTFKGCGNTSIGKAYLEPIVWSVCKNTYKKFKSSQIADSNLEMLSYKIAEYSKEIELREGKIEELRNETTRLLRLYTKGIFSENEIEKEKRRINTEITAEEKLIKKARSLKADAESTLEAIDVLNESSYDFDAVDKSEILQKEAVNELLSDVLVYKVDNKYTIFKINYKFNFSVYVIREVWTKKYTLVAGSMVDFIPERKSFITKEKPFPEVKEYTAEELLKILAYNGIIYK